MPADPHSWPSQESQPRRWLLPVVLLGVGVVVAVVLCLMVQKQSLDEVGAARAGCRWRMWSARGRG